MSPGSSRCWRCSRPASARTEEVTLPRRSSPPRQPACTPGEQRGAGRPRRGVRAQPSRAITPTGNAAGQRCSVNTRRAGTSCLTTTSASCLGTPGVEHRDSTVSRDVAGVFQAFRIHRATDDLIATLTRTREAGSAVSSRTTHQGNQPTSSPTAGVPAGSKTVSTTPGTGPGTKTDRKPGPKTARRSWQPCARAEPLPTSRPDQHQEDHRDAGPSPAPDPRNPRRLAPTNRRGVDSRAAPLTMTRGGHRDRLDRGLGSEPRAARLSGRPARRRRRTGPAARS